MTPTQVVVAVDGSPAAMTAISPARVIAQQLGGTLKLLVVAPFPEVATGVREQLQGTANADLEIIMQEGEPAATIMHMAEDPGIRLIVMATHGGENTSPHRLGSITQAVIVGMHPPIMLVRPEIELERRAVPLRRLLLPFDGTPVASTILLAGMPLITQLAVSLDVLYVADATLPPDQTAGSFGTPRYIDQPQHAWTAWADEMYHHLCACNELGQAHIPHQMFLAVGETATVIPQFALEHQEDAILLVHCNPMPLTEERRLQTIVAHTPCPIILAGTAVSLSHYQ